MSTKIEQAIEQYEADIGITLAQMDAATPAPVLALVMGSAMMFRQTRKQLRSAIDDRLQCQNEVIDVELHRHPVAMAEAEAYRKMCEVIGIDYLPTDKGARKDGGK